MPCCSAAAKASSLLNLNLALDELKKIKPPKLKLEHNLAKAALTAVMNQMPEVTVAAAAKSVIPASTCAHQFEFNARSGDGSAIAGALSITGAGGLSDSAVVGESLVVANMRDPRLSGMPVVGRSKNRGVHLSVDPRSAAAQARAAHKINSGNLWHCGNIAQPNSKAANRIFEDRTKKDLAGVQKQDAAKHRVEAKRLKRVEWARVGSSSEVQDKLESLKVATKRCRRTGCVYCGPDEGAARA